MRTLIQQFCLITAVILVVAGFAPATDTYWQGTTGNWSTGSNWDSGEPISGDKAYINNGGTAQVTLSGEQCNTLYVGDGSSDSGTVDLSGTGGLSVFSEVLGRFGTGTFIQTGGTHAVTNTLSLGINTTSSGTYKLSGTGSLSVQMEIFGNAGTGTFIQTGGTHTVTEWLTMGSSSTGHATYNLSGTGSLSVYYHENIGGTGTGIFDHTGGTNTVTHDLNIGYVSGSNGTYNLSGTGSLSVDDEYVGHHGSGTFTQSGGTNATNLLSLGSESPGNGTYTISSGTLDVQDGAISVGPTGGGTGTFNLNGGTVMADEFLLGSGGTFSSSGTSSFLRVNTLTGFGASPVFAGSVQIGHAGGAGSGSHSIGGGQAFSVGNDLTIGYDAPGTFDQTGGTNTVNDWFCLGSHASGAYNLSGTGILSAGREYIGYYDTGTFIQTGGTHTISADLDLGDQSGSSGIYNLSGTGILSTYREHIGVNGTGTFTQTGGTHTMTYGFAVGYWEGIGTYDLSGTGSLSGPLEYIGYYGTGSFTQTGGTNTVSDTLALGVASTGEGTYTISAGTLDVRNGTISVGPTGFGTGEFNLNGGTVVVDEFSLGDGGMFSCGVGSSTLRVNTLTGFGDTVSFPGPSFQIGHSGGIGSGSYSIGVGQSLVAGTLTVGYDAPGTFTQSNGANTTNSLYVGREVGGNGSYILSGGNLTAYHIEMIGSSGTGMFTQSNGTNAITNSLYMGYNSGSNGTYTMSGGSLSVPDLVVGRNGGGKLNITNAGANITVSNLLKFGSNSTFTAVPGATIHMTGSSLENTNTDPTDLAELDKLTLIFEGGVADIDPFEVAGEDRGAVMAGWSENFDLNTLTLGGVNVGKVQLVNNFDNQPGWVGSEALYVTNLNIAAGSYLDLNGLNLYYLNGSIDPGATIVGGSPIRVSDSECTVDLIEFAKFAEYWLNSGEGLPADLYEDENDIVNLLDLMVFIEYWLDPCPGDWPL